MSRQADLLEAYHNILYVINNAPLNSYPKFGKMMSKNSVR